MKTNLLTSQSRFFRTIIKLLEWNVRTFLLLIFFCTSTFANGTTQARENITISLKRVPLKTVFDAIEEQTGIALMYDLSVVNDQEIVSIDIHNADMKAVFEELFREKPLHWSKRGNVIRIVRKSKLKVVPKIGNRFGSIKIQDFCNQFNIVDTLRGNVTDTRGEPLIGVNILVKGTEKGISTDFEGRFTLLQVVDSDILIVSYIGYTTKEIPVNGMRDIEIILNEDSQTLEELVVVGYGTQKQENLTGAVSHVGSEVLESRPLTTIGEGLQGTISNLNISPNSGAPGQGATFNIRGTTSLSGGSPLVLVNGVAMDINMVNPQDIESVTVLKDGASAAIYGARAAFGVILITTKSGRVSDKPKISVNSNYSINAPVTTVEWFNSKEIVEWMDEAYLRTTGNPYYDEIERNAILAHFNDPSQPASIIHPNNPNEWTNVANTNWNDVLMENSYPMQQHSISISGGTEKLTYYSSFSYLNQKGIINRDLFDEHYNRFNFLTDLDYKVTNWLSVGTRVSANLSNKRFPTNDSWFRSSFPEGYLPFQQNTYATMALRDPNGNWSHIGSIHNLAQMLDEGGYQTRNISDLWLTGLLKLTPFEGMSINMDYSYNPMNQRELLYSSLLPFYDVTGNVNGYYGGSNPNRVIRQNGNNQYHALNIYADYAKSFGNNHNFKFLLGFNQEYKDFLSVYSERRNLIINEIPYLDLASGERYASDGESEYAIRGVFSRINYNYNNKYFFEINTRYDGTSKFPQEDRYAIFPSGSIGWRIDQEEFFENLTSEFNLLKVRASYGSLGNQNVAGYYPYIGTLSVAEANYLINGQKPVEVTIPQLVSPTLTWETVIQKNLGFDVSVLDYRLSGSFDIYRRDTKDMLTKGVTLPAVLGIEEPNENAADLKTTGWDLEIEWNDDVNQFNYGIAITLSDYKSVITKYDNPRGLISDHYIGKDIGEIWGLVTGGIFQDDDEALAYNGSKISARDRQAGDLWHVDLNNDGEISYGSSTLDDPGDRKIIGNTTPRYSFGLRTFFDWKGFDLTVFFQGVGKRDRWMNTRYYLTTYTGEWTPRPRIMLDYWSSENRDALYPRPIRTNTQDITATQTRFLQNAAYIRLKQLTFGYTIPSKFTQKISVEQFRIHFSGSNLWTGTKTVEIADPELAGPISYPLYKAYSLGANIQF
ncbi:TonB-dependent receptor [Membranihabitans maritimus]|uniref:TonB-dependent receptor n=1 Tax=Membranihabitans maritimus TaxID=2904244 RepID=UPI001F218892|nr:TonB-dependent receptor [Membranihabitans maritimus]